MFRRKPADDLGIAEQLFPGFGMFGHAEAFWLSIPLNCIVDRVELFIDDDTVAMLNLAGVEFRAADGSTISPDALISEVALSSSAVTRSAAELRTRFAAGQLVSSGREIRPKLTLSFTAPTEISEIIVRNRRGKWGGRTRNLRLQASLDGAFVLDAPTASSDQKIEALGALRAALDTAGLLPRRVWRDARAAAEDLRGSVLTALRRGALDWPPRELLRFLRVLQSTAGPTPFETELCAEIVLRLLKQNKKDRLPTADLSCFALLLKRPAHIEAVMARANARRLEMAADAPPLLISKHLVHTAVLLSHREVYLRALDRYFCAMADAGIDTCICYGTLLGAVRESGFLPHDDDVDVLLFTGARSFEAAVEALAALPQRVQVPGVTFWGTPTDGNIHASVEGAHIDIFTSWETDGEIFTLMGKAGYRPVPRARLLPLSTMPFYDRVYPAPADPKGYLTERYGPGWTVADPYFEWPWPLKE